MLKIFSFGFLLHFLWSTLGYSQDTIKIGVINDVSDLSPKWNPEFYDLVSSNYEKIVFQDSTIKIDFCYLRDTVRYRYGGTCYKFIDDSSLVLFHIGDLDSTFIHFVQIDSSLFQIKIKEEGYTVHGQLENLIPYDPIGTFTAIYNNGDTLWKTNYDRIHPGSNFFIPITVLHPEPTDDVYSYYEVDEPPNLNWDESPAILRVERTDYCINEGPTVVRSIRAVVSESGKVLSVRVHQGFYHYNSCPWYLIKILLELKSKEPLKPAIHEGVPVKSTCVIKIDMMDDYLNEYANHPGFDRDFIVDQFSLSMEKNIWKSSYLIQE